MVVPTYIETCKVPVKSQASKNADVFVSPSRSHLQKDKGQNQWFVGRHVPRHMSFLCSPWDCHTCLSAASASSHTQEIKKGENKKGR